MSEEGQEDKPKPSYYAVIPAHVRYDETLPPNAKLLYGEITALCNMEGFCWASNRYFAELYGVKIRAVQNWIDALRSAGHILVDPIDGYKRHIRLPEAERAAQAKIKDGSKAETRAKKDTPANKNMPRANKDMGGMTQKTPRHVPKDTHNITSDTTINTTRSIAAVAASESSLALLEEQRKKEPAKPVPHWGSLSDAKRAPYAVVAERELKAMYPDHAGSIKPRMIEVRARNLFEIETKK